MAVPQTITMRAFRGMDTFSGEVRVVAGSRTRRGVRRQMRRASCNSRRELAGSDAVRGLTAGESAHASDARAADHKTDADSAEPKAKKAKRTPKKKPTTKKQKAKNRKHANRRKPAVKQRNESKAAKGEAKGKGGKPPIESLWDERAQLDGGVPLPEDGVGFVDAVNVNIDLIRLTEILLRERDERSSKSLLERLLEMRYGKNARALMAETGPVIDSAPRATRD